MKGKLLVILGPTSTGKTDLALELAKKFNGELISADSRQVYKYLNIGTGKMPGNVSSIKGQVLREDDCWIFDGIKVWMYDVASPKDKYNLYQYVLKAKGIVNKISDSGKQPILVGGTGLYIRSLLEGISELGIGENKILRQELEELDIKEIQTKISSEILKNLNVSELNNKRRLIRLYEKLTGPKNDKSFSGIEKDFEVLKIGLTTDRKQLRARIKLRLNSRINQGMIEESKRLLENKTLTFERMGELGLEYRYIAKLLKGEIKSQDEFIEILSLKIGQFAKRQETWFKKEKNVVWFDILEEDFKRQVEKQVLDWYNDPK